MQMGQICRNHTNMAGVAVYDLDCNHVRKNKNQVTWVGRLPCSRRKISTASWWDAQTKRTLSRIGAEVARQAHNLQAVGSNPTSATISRNSVN